MVNLVKSFVILMSLVFTVNFLYARDWNKEYLNAVSSIPIVFSDDGICSGALIDLKHILTAYHCVASMRDIKIIWHDQINIFDTAYVAGVDPENDLAILRLHSQGSHNPLLIIGEEEEVSVGVEVFTIGHPTRVTSLAKFPVDLGNTHLISSGIISKVNNDELVYDFSVSPGNSGGPVINSDGKIIGVVSKKRAGILVGDIGYAPGHRAVNELYEKVLEQKSKLDWSSAEPFTFDFSLTYSVHNYFSQIGESNHQRILLGVEGTFFDRVYLTYATTVLLDHYNLRNWSMGYKFHQTFNNLSTLTLIPTVEHINYLKNDSETSRGLGAGLLTRYSVLPISFKLAFYQIDHEIYNSYSIYLVGSF